MNQGRFPYKILTKYPHMKPADIFIWEDFIKGHPGFFLTVDYDFPVGEGSKFLPTTEDTPAGRENRLYRRKIDVVGYTENETWIIEIKPHADIATLGQILTYGDLARKSNKLGENQILTVICSKITAEMKPIFARYGITVFVV